MDNVVRRYKYNIKKRIGTVIFLYNSFFCCYGVQFIYAGIGGGAGKKEFGLFIGCACIYIERNNSCSVQHIYNS